jgi:dienelactone hydrolase
MKLLLAFSLGLILAGPALPAAGEIETRDVTYQGGTVQSKGYLAMPKGEGPFPGVLVLHEWWGRNDYVTKRAEMLAELGYAALAVDLFGEGKLAHEPKAGWALMMPVFNNMDEMSARFKGAMACLVEQKGVDAKRVAAIGYSFGGSVCLQMARNGLPGLDGVAAFHPFLRLRAPNPPIDQLTAKILVCHGGESVFARPGMKEAVQKEMNSANADMKFLEYPTAMDSFTNPDASKLGEKFQIPMVYDPQADAASWKELQTFLDALWNPAPDEG